MKTSISSTKCFNTNQRLHLCPVAQLCPTPCNAMDSSPLASSVHGIFQGRILEWVAISYSRGSSRPTDRTCISGIFYIGRRIFFFFFFLTTAPLRISTYQNTNYYYVYCYFFFHLLVPGVLIVFYRHSAPFWVLFFPYETWA